MANVAADGLFAADPAAPRCRSSAWSVGGVGDALVPPLAQVGRGLIQPRFPAGGLASSSSMLPARANRCAVLRSSSVARLIADSDSPARAVRGSRRCVPGCVSPGGALGRRHRGIRPGATCTPWRFLLQRAPQHLARRHCRRRHRAGPSVSRDSQLPSWRRIRPGCATGAGRYADYMAWVYRILPFDICSNDLRAAVTSRPRRADLAPITS
jgi:hypothetical protein